MMNTTYFYDSDLYGGTVDHIASSIVFSGDMKNLINSVSVGIIV